MAQVLEREVHPLLSGFYDTPFIVWLLKTRPEYWEKVYLEDEISLNRHWLQFVYGAEEVATLITHYAGGQLTSPECGADSHTFFLIRTSDRQDGTVLINIAPTSIAPIVIQNI